MPVILLILAIPLIEIAVIIWVGGRIGAFWTLLLVVAAAVAGVALLRRQGVGIGAALRNLPGTGPDPASAVAEAGLLMVAAVLLVVPGFLGDLVAVFLLFPPARRWLSARFLAGPQVFGQTMPMHGTVLEGEFEVVGDLPEGTAAPHGIAPH